ncbi:hypothetical protein ACHHYP_12615 [Achlya hypogyna]|uniref:C2 NT-type domain-containing protein n=1 Tax=Achlya hypogyna TaxID=1202772 RepID=A0A1V9ZGS0_ACHHY|nr:hypothetical protein ACHHYP_12615 [Achlya hypogyna]
MSRFLRAATHAGKTGVGFVVQITLHRLTTCDPEVQEADVVYAVATRGNHKAKSALAKIGPFRSDTGSRHVQWGEEVLSFHSTMYRNKSTGFQTKPMTIEIVKGKSEGLLATFELDLAAYISDKNGGVKAVDTTIQAKKSWGNASLMITISSSLDSDRRQRPKQDGLTCAYDFRPITASTTASMIQNDHESSACEDGGPTTPEKRTDPRTSSHIVQSRGGAADAPPPSGEDANTINFAAQIIKYDRMSKELQAKIENLTLQLSDAKEQHKAVLKEVADWKLKHQQLGAAHSSLQEELASLREKKAKAEKEVVLRRTELQNTLESSSRVNVVQLERIRHLTSVNEDLKAKVHELQGAHDACTAQLSALQQAAAKADAPAERTLASWSDGQSRPTAVLAAQFQTAPAALHGDAVVVTDTVAEQVVRLQAENKGLQETVASLQRELENFENQLFERSSELQHVLELHAHANAALTLKSTELQQLQTALLRKTQEADALRAARDEAPPTDAADLVALLRRDLDDLQEEVSALQAKNKVLREAKTRAEEEVPPLSLAAFSSGDLCKRGRSLPDDSSQLLVRRVETASAKRGAQKEARIAELTIAAAEQRASLEALAAEADALRSELAAEKAKPPAIVHVRDVLGAHFPTQMPPQAVEHARASSQLAVSPAVNADADVAYLKQQLRELKDAKAALDTQLVEQRSELEGALALHSRMQADSDAQLEALGRQVAALQAECTAAVGEATTLRAQQADWTAARNALQDKLAAEAKEKTALQASLEALAGVHEEVAQARVQEAVAQVALEISGLHAEIQGLREENDRLQSAEQQRSGVATEADALKTQLADLRQEAKHLQYELAEKTTELAQLAKEPADSALAESRLECAAAKAQVASLQEQVGARAELEALQAKHAEAFLSRRSSSRSSSGDSDSDDDDAPGNVVVKIGSADDVTAPFELRDAPPSEELAQARHELAICRMELEELRLAGPTVDATDDATAKQLASLQAELSVVKEVLASERKIAAERLAEIEAQLQEAQAATTAPTITAEESSTLTERIASLEVALREAQEATQQPSPPPADTTALEDELSDANAAVKRLAAEVDAAKATNAELEAKLSQAPEAASVADWQRLQSENAFFQEELISAKLKLAQLQEALDDVTAEAKKTEKELVLLKIAAAEAALKGAKGKKK